MNYRILITKTLDVPKNVFHHVYDSEEAAVKEAQAKLVELDADVAVVMRLMDGDTKVIHRFEKIGQAS